jgi:hypothetical protein
MRKAALLLLLLSAGSLFAAGRQRVVKHPAPPPAVQGPTFNNEVVRLFQQHCQTCHHPGDIAPFSLLSYDDAKSRAPLIRAMTQSRQMPPWKATDGCGDFADARVLPQADIDTIAKWVTNGAPEGNRADLPPALTFDSGWTLGQPDMVLAYPEPYTPPADGDIYRCFTIPTNLVADGYVSAIDIHPGDRASVHHVIAYVDYGSESVRLDEADPGPGYTMFGGPGFENPGALGGWAPGMRAVMLPEDVALSLPTNARIVLQIHYHPHHAAPGPDKTEIGIYIARKKPEQLLYILPLVNRTFTIPPGNGNYKVEAGLPFPLPISMKAYLVAPHMHLLGRKMKIEARTASGETKCLVNIDDWDFNWQTLFRFKEPVDLPAGTRITATAYYDNSEANARNPNTPPKSVSWGEATTDEMCVAFLGVTVGN